MQSLEKSVIPAFSLITAAGFTKGPLWQPYKIDLADFLLLDAW